MERSKNRTLPKNALDRQGVVRAQPPARSETPKAHPRRNGTQRRETQAADSLTTARPPREATATG